MNSHIRCRDEPLVPLDAINAELIPSKSSIFDTMNQFIKEIKIKYPYLSKLNLNFNTVLDKPAINVEACVACHTFRTGVIAVSIANTKCVDIYWNSDQIDLSLNNNDNHNNNNNNNNSIYCLAWNPVNDVIYAGTSNGIISWTLEIVNDNTNNNKLIPSVKSSNFMSHPREHGIHSIAFSPDGRIFATITEGERNIIVWDAIAETNTAVWCMDGGVCAGPAGIAWSPSGMNIVVAAKDDNTRAPGGLVMLETLRWTRSSSSFNNEIGLVAWLDYSHCIYNTRNSNTLYVLSMDPERPVAREQSAQPLPILLDTSVVLSSLDDSSNNSNGGDLIIGNIVTEPTGRYVAVMFQDKIEKNENEERIPRRCPVVAIYLGSPYPSLKFTLLCLLNEPGRVPIAMQFVNRQKDATPANAGNATLVVVWRKEHDEADIDNGDYGGDITFVKHPILHAR